MGFERFKPGSSQLWIKHYRYPVAFFLCVIFSALIASPQAGFLTRLGSDFLIPHAASIAKTRTTDLPSSIALVVIDEITHQTPPFSETPEVAWTPYLGEIIKAIEDAGAAVIGLDMIFPKTISSRGLLPGYDRTFLQSLASAGRQGKLVLTETRLSETTIRPYTGQVIAVGGSDNIRPAHLTPDADNIIRRHPAFQPLENGEEVYTFAAELSARVNALPSNAILIDFTTPVTNFPTYRFSDLYQCMQAGERHIFDRFANKVVLIGTALDIEDRHVAANRLQKDKDFPILSLPCGDKSTTLNELNRASTAGVFIEARAAYTFINNTAPTSPGWGATFLLTLFLLLVMATAFLRLNPIYGFAFLTAASAMLWFVSANVLANQTMLPFLPWLLSISLLFILIYSYRVILEDQSKRWVTHAFRHYLNPELVRKLADDPDALRLGGERRRVVVLFADLAGFTTTSEEMKDAPEELVAHLHSFFQIIGENIELHHGYIDKFIGDAVMGVWGAPIEISNPERSAIKAAIGCIKEINAWN
ncbi:MAG: adenylate/guanylate cyclase domain-containing protein, partial [Alphaproteobacteria bacterium]|nr:adenylate/guanylate cyclase domain-containing protein [Alphaproteobacteria bacterium]